MQDLSFFLPQTGLTGSNPPCGYRPFDLGARIAGGAPVFPGEFPWMALMKYGLEDEETDNPTVISTHVRSRLVVEEPKKLLTLS